MNNLIIDTNILLLLIIGAVEQGRHIKNSKRLQGFDEEDYQNVLAFIKNNENIFITPYIAAGVSHLIYLKKTQEQKLTKLPEPCSNFFLK